MSTMLVASLLSCCSQSNDSMKLSFDGDIAKVDSLLAVGDTAQAVELNRRIKKETNDDLQRITARVREAEIAVAQGDLAQGEIALKECNAYYDTTRQSNKENRMLRMATAILNSTLKEKEGDEAKALDQKKVAASQAYELNARHTYVRLSKQVFDKYWQKGDYSAAINGYKRLLDYSIENKLHKETRTTLYALQNAFLSLGDTQKAQAYLDEITMLDDTAAYDKCRLDIAQAAIYICDKDYEKLGTCVESIETLIADPLLKSKYSEVFYGLKTELLLANKEFDKAKESMNMLNASNRKGDKSYYYDDYRKLLNAQTYLCLGKLDSTRIALTWIAPEVLKQKNLPLYLKYIDIVTDYYSAVGNEKMAYQYAKRKNALTDSLNFESFSYDIAYQNLAIKRDTTIIAQKLKMEQQKNIMQKLSFWRTFWIVMIVVIALAALVTYYNLSLKRMRKRELELEQESQALASEVRQRRQELQEQKEKLEEKNERLRKELEYSHHIQKNILPNESTLETNGIADHFVLYRPCDQVSGDFYWFKQLKDKLYVCVGDATGHGVPGAFIAMVASTMLNDIASNDENCSPKDINNSLDETLGKILRNNDLILNKDSVDLTTLCLDTTTLKAKLCLARHIAYIIRKDGTLEQIYGTKRSICDYDETFAMRPFEEVEIELSEGDHIYMTSDGYESQMGGSLNKKLRRKRMASFFTDLVDKPMQVQKVELERRLDEWQGTNEQTDDILIIGLKIGNA